MIWGRLSNRKYYLFTNPNPNIYCTCLVWNSYQDGNIQHSHRAVLHVSCETSSSPHRYLRQTWQTQIWWLASDELSSCLVYVTAAAGPTVQVFIATRWPTDRNTISFLRRRFILLTLLGNYSSIFNPSKHARGNRLPHSVTPGNQLQFLVSLPWLWRGW